MFSCELQPFLKLEPERSEKRRMKEDEERNRVGEYT